MQRSWFRSRSGRPLTGCALLVVTSLALSGPGDARAEPPSPEPSPPTAKLGPTAPLGARIDAILAQADLAETRIGIVAREVRSGKVLYQSGADQPLNPASNVKLVTTAAALAILGPEHRYTTTAYIGHGDLHDGVVRGDLYLEGGGDPALVTGDLYELASDLRARGITKISGGIIVDGSRFDRDELPPGFDQKDELAAYRAPSGAVSVNFNTFVVRVRPGHQVGATARVALNPPVDSISIRNELQTVEGHRRGISVQVEPDDHTVDVVVSGTIGVDAGPVAYRYPVPDPSHYAGDVLRLVLKQRGIRFGRTRISRGKVPRGAQMVGIHRSDALSMLVRSVNKLSNNFMAEQILKTLDPATPATFDGALVRVRAYLDEIGTPIEGLRLGNGSGLYDTNRISPRQITHVLRHAHRDFRYAADYVASLAIMGADGTTRSRLDESAAQRYIRAKTGTLDGISALSGYAGADRRSPIAFSILMNEVPPGHVGEARRVQDAIAEILADHASRTRAKPKRKPGAKRRR